MKAALRITAIILLLFNGLSACFGGAYLIADSSGAKIGLPLSLLQYSPFSNYLIPGVILFVSNGIFSISIAGITIARIKKYPWLIILQGCILFGWIAIQLIMLKKLYPLQPILAAVAIALILCGSLLQSKKFNSISS